MSMYADALDLEWDREARWHLPSPVFTLAAMLRMVAYELRSRALPTVLASAGRQSWLNSAIILQQHDLSPPPLYHLVYALFIVVAQVSVHNSF